MLRVGQNFHHDGDKLTKKQLSKNLDIAAEALALVIRPLEQRGLLTESCDRNPAYMPGKSLEHIRIREIWDAVRSGQESAYLNPDNVASDKTVDQLLQGINDSIDNAVADMTLLDLVERSSDST